MDTPGFIGKEIDDSLVEKKVRWIVQYFTDTMFKLDAIIFFLKASDDSLSIGV